jgi:hypothetical protein
MNPCDAVRSPSIETAVTTVGRRFETIKTVPLVGGRTMYDLNPSTVREKVKALDSVVPERLQRLPHGFAARLRQFVGPFVVVEVLQEATESVSRRVESAVRIATVAKSRAATPDTHTTPNCRRFSERGVQLRIDRKVTAIAESHLER